MNMLDDDKEELRMVEAMLRRWRDEAYVAMSLNDVDTFRSRYDWTYGALKLVKLAGTPQLHAIVSKYYSEVDGMVKAD